MEIFLDLKLKLELTSVFTKLPKQLFKVTQRSYSLKVSITHRLWKAKRKTSAKFAKLLPGCLYSLHLDDPHTNFGKRLVKFKGSTLCNNLPDNVKILNSIPAFKNNLKNYLLTAGTSFIDQCYRPRSPADPTPQRAVSAQQLTDSPTNGFSSSTGQFNVWPPAAISSTPNSLSVGNIDETSASSTVSQRTATSLQLSLRR